MPEKTAQQMEQELYDALKEGRHLASACLVRDLARAVAVKQIERWAKGEGVDRMREVAVHVVRAEIEAAKPSAEPDTAGPASAVMFILVQDGSVLMERCAKKAALFRGEWFLPGGRIDPGETPLVTLRREVEEELGVGLNYASVVELPLVDATHRRGAPAFLMRPYVVASWRGEVPNHCLDQPDTELAWVPVEKARRSPVDAVRAAIALAFPVTAHEAAKPTDQPPTVAPVSGEPGGVRVVWVDAVHQAAWDLGYISRRDARDVFDAALPHLRVEVDRKTLMRELSEFAGASVYPRAAAEFATRLGLTLSDGGTDD